MLLERVEEAHDGLRRLSHFVLQGDISPARPANEASEFSSSEEEVFESLDMRRGRRVRGDVEVAADGGGRVMPRDDTAFPAQRVDQDVLLAVGQIAC